MKFTLRRLFIVVAALAVAFRLLAIGSPAQIGLGVCLLSLGIGAACLRAGSMREPLGGLTLLVGVMIVVGSAPFLLPLAFLAVLDAL